MAAFVNRPQFEARYGSPIQLETDQARVDALLEDACAIAEELAGKSYTEDDAPAAIVAVICQAVHRIYENPLGLSGETDGNYSWQGGGSGGRVFFTLEEERAIKRAGGDAGMTSVGMSVDFPVVNRSSRYSRPLARDDQYLPVIGGGKPILYEPD